MFYVYVLYSKEYGKCYIGFSSDIKARLTGHNHPQNNGWTARYQPWELIYQEEYDTKKEAMKREQQLKSARGRQFIKSLLPPK
jgi:putative endonuclease